MSVQYTFTDDFHASLITFTSKTKPTLHCLCNEHSSGKKIGVLYRRMGLHNREKSDKKV